VAHTLNFKPIFDPTILKNCWGSPHPWWVYTSKT